MTGDTEESPKLEQVIASQKVNDFPQQNGKWCGSPEGWTHRVEVGAACYDAVLCYTGLIDLTQIAVSLAENMLVFPLQLEVAPVVMN